MNFKINLKLVPLINQLGVTLLELVITLAIAAIIMAFASPSFKNLIATNRIVSVTNAFTGGLHLARSEAVKRGTTVTICKSDDITDSSPSCNTNTSASYKGWVIFVDDNNNGNLNSGEDALRVGEPPSSAVISGDTNFANYIKFQSDGQSQGASSNDGKITICIPPNERNIIINIIGRIKIETGTCT